MESREHIFSEHLIKLNLLCRICRQRSHQRNDKRPAKICSNYTTQLKQAFDIVVGGEDEGIAVSKTMCLKCYNRMINIVNKNISSSVKSALANIDECKTLWQPYDPSISISECPICSHCDTLGFGG